MKRLHTIGVFCSFALFGVHPLHGTEKHWAYRPICRPATPEFKATSWRKNPIDQFIGNQLEAQGRKPNAPADVRTLARRVTLDLIGLPPTPMEVSNFVSESEMDADLAFQNLVNRLIASPHYGERWARSWLDLCHYADSDGYLTDQLRPVAWRYRAWLVDALNDNLPFDQFTIEQLAGDLLPNATIRQKMATGFLRQTLSNREGGADPEEFRVKQVVDRTSMVGTIWLGLTVGCAHCHDHKYDDLTQKEFFELYAFFDAADEINIDAPRPGEFQPSAEQWEEYQRQRRALLQPVQQQIRTLQDRWEEKLLGARDHPGKDWFWDRQWELLGLVWGGGLGEGQLEGWQIVMLDPSKRTKVQSDRLFDYFLSQAESIDSVQAKALKLSELNSELKHLKDQLPKVSRAPSMMQTQNPRACFVHVAGDFRDPGQTVSPNTPQVLPPLNAKLRNRLTLANWLVSAENPLTARVMVNRMWQEFFGRGIVETSDDFGVRGTPPTHPQLLDWLAHEFIRSDWDMKYMHRLITSSATYRQCSRQRSTIILGKSAVTHRDRLFGRQIPIRLTAEQIRDGALCISGLWDSRLGGPSVRPPQPDSVSHQGYGNSWNVSSGGDQYRRGIYTFVQRTSPFAMHITFDAPNPNHVCARRYRSNTPLQALTLLNDPVFFDAAIEFGKRVKLSSRNDRARIEFAFQSCFARHPNPNEVRVLLQLLEKYRENDGVSVPSNKHVDSKSLDAWTILCSVLFNLHEFITRD